MTTAAMTTTMSAVAMTTAAMTTATMTTTAMTTFTTNATAITTTNAAAIVPHKPMLSATPTPSTLSNYAYKLLWVADDFSAVQTVLNDFEQVCLFQHHTDQITYWVSYHGY